MGNLIYRESVIDKQGNLSGKKWVVLFPFPANCYQTCHAFVQFGCGAARLQGDKRDQLTTFDISTGYTKLMLIYCRSLRANYITLSLQ